METEGESSTFDRFVIIPSIALGVIRSPVRLFGQVPSCLLRGCEFSEQDSLHVFRIARKFPIHLALNVAHDSLWLGQLQNLLFALHFVGHMGFSSVDLSSATQVQSGSGAIRLQ